MKVRVPMTIQDPFTARVKGIKPIEGFDITKEDFFLDGFPWFHWLCFGNCGDSSLSGRDIASFDLPGRESVVDERFDVVDACLDIIPLKGKDRGGEEEEENERYFYRFVHRFPLY